MNEYVDEMRYTAAQREEVGRVAAEVARAVEGVLGTLPRVPEVPPEHRTSARIEHLLDVLLRVEAAVSGAAHGLATLDAGARLSGVRRKAVLRVVEGQPGLPVERLAHHYDWERRSPTGIAELYAKHPADVAAVLRAAGFRVRREHAPRWTRR